MSAVLLSPHNDDETLFASFLCMKHRPRVIVCYRSVVQEALYGITAANRERETARALSHFDLQRSWQQWLFPDDHDDVPEKLLFDVVALERDHELCIAPAVEVGGTFQHNTIGRAALDAFGHDRVIAYTTYTNGGHRTSIGEEVEVDPDWIDRKLHALAEYRSQFSTPSRVHFMESLREYTT